MGLISLKDLKELVAARINKESKKMITQELRELDFDKMKDDETLVSYHVSRVINNINNGKNGVLKACDEFILKMVQGGLVYDAKVVEHNGFGKSTTYEVKELKDLDEINEKILEETLLDKRRV